MVSESRFRAIAAVILVLVVLGTLVFFLPENGKLTGLVTLQKLNYYNLTYDEQIAESTEKPFTPNGKLQSFRVSGIISRNGTTKMYLKDGEEKYLVFDSNLLEYSTAGLKNFGNDVRLISNLPESNNEKKVTIALGYNSNSNFDVENDGIEDVSSVIDFTAKDTTFNWEADEGKLCTRWQVYDYDAGKDNIICLGSNDCCRFAGIESLGGSWDDAFYLYYNRFGAGKRNIVRAQVLYVDYNTSVENPYTDIAYSSWADTKAVFTTNEIDFTDVCVETCAVNLEDKLYDIGISIENSSLYLSSANYGILEIARNKAPKFNALPDIRIKKNSSYEINLSGYVYDEDNDSVSLGYITQEGNVSVLVGNSTATIIPDSNYTGTFYLTFTANDTETIGISNYIRVEVYEEVDLSQRAVLDNITQGFAVVGKPVRWTRRISLNESIANLKLNISEDALNISVKKAVGNVETEIKDEKIVVKENGLEKNISEYEEDKKIELIEERIAELNEKKKEFIGNAEKLREINAEIIRLRSEKNSVTGYTVLDIEDSWFADVIEWLFGSITGAVIADNLDNTTGIELVVNEPVSELVVEYETPAPIADEVDVSDSIKNITISSAEHYTNILAFTSIPELPRNAIKLYHIVNGTRENAEVYQYVDSDNDGYVDEIQWIVPSLSNETYEVELTILTVQSYPMVGGTWTVDFTTVGTADLTISGTDGTAYGVDLTPELLKCGDDEISFTYNGTASYYNNYNCDNVTSHYTVRVHTAGKHTQEFRFGNVTGYAFNIAEQGTPIINMTDHPYNTTNANLTAYNVSSVNSTKSIFNWFVNNASIAVLNMPFENHTGDETLQAVDYSGYGNNGSIDSATFLSTGGYGGSGAYEFDGRDDWINISHSSSMNFRDGISVEAWIKPQALNSTKPNSIVANLYNGTNQAFYLAIDPRTGGASTFNGTGIGIGYYNSSFALWRGTATGWMPSLNIWYHVIGTYNGTAFAIYVNGSFVNATRHIGGIPLSTSKLYIGAYNTPGNSFLFNGTIDNVRIYNRSLSPQEIKALYNNQSNLIVSQELIAGQTWWVNITPNDGVEDGNSLKSNEITIDAYAQSIPTHTTPILNATDSPSNTTNANLTAYNQSTTDTDGQVVKNIYNWFVNNQSIAVLNMPFENHTGDETLQAVDYSGYGNNGSVNSASFLPTGGYGGTGAYEFNGGGSYINVSYKPSLNVTTTFSVEAWIKPMHLNNTLENAIVVHANANNGGITPFWLAISNRSSVFGTTGIGIGFDNGTWKGTATGWMPSTNTWYHVVGSYNGTDFAIFVNGTLVNTTRLISTSPGYGTEYLIGRHSIGSFPMYFNGTIDEVRIYNRSLSASEVRAHYENKTNIIVEQETAINETWWVNVTPNDGVEDGNSLKSNEIMIQNTPPNATSIKINTTDNLNRTNGTVLGFFDYSDAEGTAQVRNQTRWFINYTYISPYDNLTALSNDNTTKGYNFTFSARVYDGSDWSVWENSTTLTIANAVPEHNTPIVNATDYPTNSTNANLTAWNQSTSDVDGDRVKNIYNWFVNNSTITMVNLPFEADGGSQNASSRDFSALNNSIVNVSLAVWNSTGGFDGKGAYEFNGSTSNALNFRLNHFNNASVTQGTIMFWFNAYGSAMLFSLEDRIEIVRNTNWCNNKFSATIRGLCLSSPYYPTNSWQFFTLTWNGSVGAIYLNATLINTTPVGSPDPDAVSRTPRIGNRNSLDMGFNGKIDEFMWFNRSLSPEQIRVIYLNQSNVIVQNETATGEVWYVNVTPNDGTAYGASLISNEITIQLADISGPGFSNATTNATVYYAKNNVTFNITFLDDNALSHYTFSWNNGTAWYNDSSDAISGTRYNVSVIKGINIPHNSNFQWKWHVNDTISNYNETAIYNFTITNSPPTHSTPVLNSSTSANSTRNNITCNVISANDNDEDPISTKIQWLNGSVEVLDIQNRTSIDSTYPGDTWYCNVSLSDGIEYGDIKRSNNITMHGYPEANLTKPLNASTRTNANNTFNYAINQTHINSCSLFANKTSTWTAWQNSTASLNTNNFSLILRNGGYKWNVWCNTTTNDPGFFRSNFSLTVDVPNIGVSYAGGTLGNSSNVSRTWVYVNLSITATDLANITYQLFNSSRQVINTSLKDEATTYLNFTNLEENTFYYYNATLEDYAGNRNFTDTRIITLDTIPPNVTLYNPTPVNGSIGNGSVSINWSVRDNIDVSLECNTTINGLGNQTFYMANNSFAIANYSLTEGLDNLSIVCYDDAGNVNSSDTRQYVNAVVNVTHPRHNAIFKQNNSINITVGVVSGTNYINNVTLFIYNNTFQATQASSSLWYLPYNVVNITPQFLNITATGFHNDRRYINTSSVRQIRVSKEGTIASPVYEKLCSNQTYSMNGSNVTIANIIDLDTMLESIAVNVTVPDGGIFTPNITANASNSNSVYYMNYTFYANNSGRYTMNAIVQDIANNTVDKTEYFYVGNASKRANISNEGFTTLTLNDICLGNAVHNSGTTAVMPNVSSYDVAATTSKITLTLRNYTLTADINNTINFTQRTTESTAPSGQRRIDMFDLNANKTYYNVTLLFNYSSFSHTLTHESNMKMYRCENEDNCEFEQQNMTLNTTTKTILMELPALSRYILTEPALTNPDLLQIPSVNYINVSRMYAPVNEVLNITVDLNISLGIDNVTVTVNGSSTKLVATRNTSKNYHYTYNFTPTNAAEYTVSVFLRDQNTFNTTANKTFFVDSRQSFTLDAPGANNITVYDADNNESVGKGIPLALNEPSGRYDVEVRYNSTRIMIINASLNSSVSSIFNLTDVAESVTAPTNRINMDQFEANTSLGFSSLIFYYNYTNVSSVTNEANLEVFKCSDSNNCSWSQVGDVTDTINNIVSFNVTTLSLFDIVESIRTVTQQTSVTEPGGGGAGTKYIEKLKSEIVQLEISTAHVVTMEPNETIEMPLIIKNKGQVNLTSVNLGIEPKSEFVSAGLKKSYFDRLDAGQTAKTVLTVSSYNLYNSTEVLLRGISKSPVVEDELMIVIRPIVSLQQTEASMAADKLKFVGDVFEENPECLELSEMLELANAEIKKGNYAKAIGILDKTLNVCRDLISYRKQAKAQFLGPSYIWAYQAITALLLLYISMDFYFNHSQGVRKHLDRLRKIFSRRKR